MTVLIGGMQIIMIHPGSATGEHGIGQGKQHYMKAELGEESLKLLWQIKKLVDPLNIMNPGKLYPPIN